MKKLNQFTSFDAVTFLKGKQLVVKDARYVSNESFSGVNVEVMIMKEDTIYQSEGKEVYSC